MSSNKSVAAGDSTAEGDEFDFDDNFEGDEPCGSDEDTEDASENEFRRHDIPTPSQEKIPDLKEQIYQEKLNYLRSQLEQLNEGSLPEYLKKVKKLDLNYKERVRLNNIYREHAIDLAEKDYIAEKRAAIKEYDEKSIELKENLIQYMEEKRKTIESERLNMELSGDLAETKPAMTRKLRRRPNDPAPIPEKRRGKTSSLPSQINFLLDEKEIEADLKAIARGSKNVPAVKKPANNTVQAAGPVVLETQTWDAKIEDGKLLYEKKWFHRGQTVYVENKEAGRFPATISAIGTEAIHVKKSIDSTKIKIYVNQLVRGKFIIKRRAS